MCKVADYVFMLHDYYLSHAIYDAIHLDYETENTYNYHDGIQEMIGTCILIMHQSLNDRIDVDRNFELVVQQYIDRR